MKQYLLLIGGIICLCVLIAIVIFLLLHPGF